ncbi:hydantoinase/oxoprolinase family protein [Conexibacter sp. JD483]|uniref:hydantoinase/oxoprolinase family protein n=1 Tax=unclassified Conexibacter TaxID=2627773 RepID=UPI00271A7D96|nr:MULTISPECIES: hydantoinase/oxoprolinase family protein [unclassified Conexibacter]MDO8188693.1 hydantoinase/oxoprolinase family protein [Conexibacter sp. CPCC 205706]MDO8201559.1 hydantoinase/oxoprolinase family protein [Conexibacter sp. CPCC 205762]MDR9371650.1 hydantoinase/oxoprolinase family protein [Conexibacter sp. JD483]
MSTPTRETDFYVGSDIGGTFTDTVLLTEDGEVHMAKSPTTKEELTRGAISALELAAGAIGVAPEQIGDGLVYYAHGTTQATNAFIERKGVRTGLLTTRGFRDVLRSQRSTASWAGLGHTARHYSARTLPQPIVPLDQIREIEERVDYKGAVIVPLNEQQLREAVRELVADGCEAIAITFLWAFRNDVHERRAVEIIGEEAPGLFVSAASQLLPILGEYERTSTTSINAYLGPIIARYVTNLEGELRDSGFRGELSIMESGGGVLPSGDAATQAAAMLTSGPAGGVLASAALAAEKGWPNVITSDMGGTSFDVGLVVDGEPLLTRNAEVGRFHVALPMIGVTAIGAGGGSIARVDDGHLTVGPESAGARPGPACYGRGGTRPTVTDADVVLGIIDPEYFLGGNMGLDRAAAEQAIREHVAEPLGLSLLEAAAGIRSVADNHMADLLRKVTLRAGYDPRDFVVFAYGGAGPTHAHRYALEAGIRTVFVPATAAVHSAYGAVTSDRHRTFTVAHHAQAPRGFERASEHVSAAEMEAAFATLTQRCEQAMGTDQLTMRRYVGMRFRQQVHELAIELPAGAVTGATVDQLVEDFTTRYEHIYGRGTALRVAGVEFTVLRVDGHVPVTRPAPAPKASSLDPLAPSGSREIWFEERGALTTTAVYRPQDLAGGGTIAGPAAIEQAGTTVIVGPDQRALVDGHGHITIEIPQEDQ